MPLAMTVHGRRAAGRRVAWLDVVPYCRMSDVIMSPGWVCFSIYLFNSNLHQLSCWPWRQLSRLPSQPLSLSSTSPWCYSVFASDCSSIILILNSKSKNKQETDQFLERHKFLQLTQEDRGCCCNLHLLVIE